MLKKKGENHQEARGGMSITTQVLIWQFTDASTKF